MHLARNFLALFVHLVAFAPCHGFFDWFGIYGGQPATLPVVDDPKDFNKDGTAVSVPFEMSTSDEDFLKEGKKYGLQLSKLDVCHHKVFLNLKASCSSLSEEDMGKLSVRLLNCQSAVEGRATFPCADDMSLRECTKSMDQHTWNAYHLVSNRARAVCYSTRQQQFHAKTEMTINKLVWSSDQQARAMSEFERSQLRVSENQEELMAQQEKLKSSQQNVQVFVAENLKELTIEKALIAAGQRELARMTDSIRKKLDAASNMLLTNEQQRQISHRQLVQDLSTVQEYAKFLQEKLDIGAKDLHSHHKETSMQFEDTLNNLSKINASIGYLQKMVEETRVELGDKLGWVVRYLHGSGERLTVLLCCVLHACYLLVAMFLAAFLHVPMTSRFFLLLLVPMNALSELQEGSSLRFGALTVLLAIFVLVDYAHCAFRSRRRRCCVPALEANGVQEVPVATTLSSCTTRPHEQDYSTPLVDGEGDSPIVEPLPDVVEPVPNSPDGLPRRWRWERASRSSTPIRDRILPSPEELSLEHNCDGVPHEPRWSSSTHNIESNDLPLETSTPNAFPSLERRASVDIGSPVRRDLLSFLDLPPSDRRQSSPARSFSSTTSSRSRRLCSALTRAGTPCKCSCVRGKDVCHNHQ